MNHDYAHCADFTNDCPKGCFRAQLSRDLKERTDLLGLPFSWMHFKGTDECPRERIRRMADFQKVMEQYDRMCIESMGCDDCPIASMNNGDGAACHRFIRKFPEKAERIIMKWAKEHPIVTNAMKFKEIFGYDFQDAFGALGCSEWLDDEYERGKQYE